MSQLSLFDTGSPVRIGGKRGRPKGVKDAKPRKARGPHSSEHKAKISAGHKARTPRPDNFTPAMDALLGKGHDRIVAIVLGRNLRAVHKRRKRLGIKPYRRYREIGRRDPSGYLVSRLRPDDPLITMARGDGEVMTHRLVMARHLRRPLERDEFVHHRNGIRSDNRIENLELWTRSHPDGQRLDDVLLWATKLVDRYGRAPSVAEPESPFETKPLQIGQFFQGRQRL